MRINRANFLESVALIAAMLVLAFLIRSMLFTVIRVDGESMRDTYFDGELLLVTIPDLQMGGATRGDVVILRYPGARGLFVKRVVALAGDVVEMRAGRLIVNGRREQEPPGARADAAWLRPVRVDEDCVFVLGDNRANSSDSRTIGAVPESMLVGRVRGSLWGGSGRGN